ncbi:hypothetical protein PEPMIC_01667 [Parvimonas micra ATCC 33270]|uniref:Uncharacterized protein n=1 Tax=Parvimonas micra ATCC 33270 TaxID=411465 RepID=A8SNG7_9FIRM|nr:hypothetical protein PEPMIC_01667 [Parvimonas micra ATCC 33270]
MILSYNILKKNKKCVIIFLLYLENFRLKAVNIFKFLESYCLVKNNILKY